MQIPNLRTWTDDEVVTAAMLNEQIRDHGNFVLNPPQAQMLRDVDNQTLTEGAVEQVTYTSITRDNDSMASTVTSEMTINTPGLYLISSVVYLQCLDGLVDSLAIVRHENSDGSVGANIARNEKDHDDRTSTGYTLNVVQPLALGDRLFTQVRATRSTGATQPLVVNPSGAPASFAAVWIGE